MRIKLPPPEQTRLRMCVYMYYTEAKQKNNNNCLEDCLAHKTRCCMMVIGTCRLRDRQPGSATAVAPAFCALRAPGRELLVAITYDALRSTLQFDSLCTTLGLRQGMAARVAVSASLPTKGISHWKHHDLHDQSYQTCTAVRMHSRAGVRASVWFVFTCVCVCVCVCCVFEPTIPCGLCNAPGLIRVPYAFPQRQDLTVWVSSLMS